MNMRTLFLISLLAMGMSGASSTALAQEPGKPAESPKKEAGETGAREQDPDEKEAAEHGDEIMREAMSRLLRRRGAKKDDDSPLPVADWKGKIIDKRGRYAVRRLKDLPYYEGEDAHPRKHRLDLYLPEGVSGFPVLVFVHGGGWVSGDKRLYSNVGRAFAREGFGVAVINYRLSPDVLFPEHARDVARAVAWTWRNLPRLGGDGKHLFLSGHSAGGHLSALVALDRSYLVEQGLTGNEITAVAPVSGVYRVSLDLFSAFTKEPEMWAKASPIKHVRADAPPFHLFVGDRDYPNLKPDAENFKAALEGVGGAPKMSIIADRTHITMVMRIGLRNDATTRDILEFFRAFLPDGSPAKQGEATIPAQPSPPSANVPGPAEPDEEF